MVVGDADDASEATLIVRINTICQFWSGLCRTCAGSGCSPTRRCERDLLDMLCARLEQLMRHEEGRDLVTLQHKFVVVWKGGSEVCAPPPHFYFFPRVMSMIMFAANARFHAGRVRPPRRALRNGTHRWPAVRSSCSTGEHSTVVQVHFKKIWYCDSEKIWGRKNVCICNCLEMYNGLNVVNCCLHA